jgi:hypothetical protein
MTRIRLLFWRWWFYQNICMQYGACRQTMSTMRYAGRSSRPGSRGEWKKTSAFELAAKSSVSEVSGSGGIKNIKSGMRLILRGTSITFNTIP